MTMTMLSPKEAADRCQVPLRVIVSATDSGALAHATLGGKTRIHPDDLAAWIARNTMKAWEISPRTGSALSADRSANDAGRNTGTQPTAANVDGAGNPERKDAME